MSFHRWLLWHLPIQRWPTALASQRSLQWCHRDIMAPQVSSDCTTYGSHNKGIIKNPRDWTLLGESTGDHWHFYEDLLVDNPRQLIVIFQDNEWPDNSFSVSKIQSKITPLRLNSPLCYRRNEAIVHWHARQESISCLQHSGSHSE